MNGLEAGEWMFTGSSIFIAVIFVIMMGIIIVTVVQGIRQWNKNNNSPRLTVRARVVTKRTDIRHHNSAGQNMSSSASTTYFVTFEVDSGDRMELKVMGQEYGMLVEGDTGNLTFQGTRYLKFERFQ